MKTARAPIIEVVGATRTFLMGEIEVHALRDAHLDIREGELLVIVGPSGSGKSTLLNLLGGMDRPTTGCVRFGEQDLASASDHELTLYRRHEVGFVFQLYNLMPMLTARENVEVAAELARDPLDALQALELVGLADRASHFPAQLSGGEQQRVAIARALVGQPRLLLCDEPTGALDTQMGAQILTLLVDLKQRLGKTVVLITHNLAIAEIADRALEIRDGRIVSVSEHANPLPVEQLRW